MRVHRFEVYVGSNIFHLYDRTFDERGFSRREIWTADVQFHGVRSVRASEDASLAMLRRSYIRMWIVPKVGVGFEGRECLWRL